MRPKVPCLSCGVLTPKNRLNRCERCSAAFTKVQPAREQVRRASSSKRGYDSRWRKLSEHARKLQPFCVDCGTTYDLQADHTPEAWARHEEGKPVRLQDIDVVCGDCNRKRGAARGSRATRHVGG